MIFLCFNSTLLNGPGTLLNINEAGELLTLLYMQTSLWHPSNTLSALRYKLGRSGCGIHSGGDSGPVCSISALGPSADSEKPKMRPGLAQVLPRGERLVSCLSWPVLACCLNLKGVNYSNYPDVCPEPLIHFAVGGRGEEVGGLLLLLPFFFLFLLQTRKIGGRE